MIIDSTISCGVCWLCRRGSTPQCDLANPNGPDAGTCFFTGPAATGPVNGLQAEAVRVPWAMNTLVPIPEAVSDDQAILLSDIFPTGWYGAQSAGVRQSDVVAVFGAGVVGQFVIASAQRQGAARVIVVDGIETRLAAALAQNAEIIDFNREDPVEVIKGLTNGMGVDAVIDAVGVDAQRPKHGPAAASVADLQAEFDREVQEVAPDADPRGDQWVPGDAPSLVSRWAVHTVAKSGRIGIIGVYSPTAQTYPIGEAMNKNLTITVGNANHHTIAPPLLDLVATGAFDPTAFITQQEPTVDAIEAYKTFDRREEGWLKTELVVADA